MKVINKTLTSTLTLFPSRVSRKFLLQDSPAVVWRVIPYCLLHGCPILCKSYCDLGKLHPRRPKK